MRVLIFLLLFCNLLLLALVMGWVDAAPVDRVPPSPALSPDRIALVSRGEPPPRLVPEAIPDACIEWAAISRSSAGRIIDAGEGTGLRFTRTEIIPERVVWRVLIPSAVGGSKLAAEKKMAELKKLGVKNYALIEDAGPDHLGVLLVEHDSDAEANAALAGLRKKGVRSAKAIRRSLGEAQERLLVTGPPEQVLPLRTVVPEDVGIACPAPLPPAAVAAPMQATPPPPRRP